MAEASVEGGPTQVLIYGEDNSLTRQTIRMAAERDDLEVLEATVEWIPSAEKFAKKLQYSSSYRTLSDMPLAEDKINQKSSTMSQYDPHKIPVVATGGATDRLAISYKFDHVQKQFAMGSVILAKRLGRAAPLNGIPHEQYLYIPGLSNPGSVGADSTRPTLIPSAAQMAVTPILDELDFFKGVTQAHVVEMKCYGDGQALVDSTGQRGEQHLEGQQVGAALSSLRVENDLTLTASDIFSGYDLRDTDKLLRTMRIDSYTIPVTFGARAIVSVGLQERFTVDDVVEKLSSIFPDNFNDVISTTDLRDEDRHFVLNPNSFRKHGQTVIFDAFYDPIRSVATAALDAAVLTSRNKIKIT